MQEWHEEPPCTLCGIKAGGLRCRSRVACALPAPCSWRLLSPCACLPCGLCHTPHCPLTRVRQVLRGSPVGLPPVARHCPVRPGGRCSWPRQRPASSLGACAGCVARRSRPAGRSLHGPALGRGVQGLRCGRSGSLMRAAPAGCRAVDLLFIRGAALLSPWCGYGTVVLRCVQPCMALFMEAAGFGLQ